MVEACYHPVDSNYDCHFSFLSSRFITSITETEAASILLKTTFEENSHLIERVLSNYAVRELIKTS